MDVETFKNTSPATFTEPIVKLELKYEQTINYLEKKLGAYKSEYIKEKQMVKK